MTVDRIRKSLASFLNLRQRESTTLPGMSGMYELIAQNIYPRDAKQNVDPFSTEPDEIVEGTPEEVFRKLLNVQGIDKIAQTLAKRYNPEGFGTDRRQAIQDVRDRLERLSQSRR